MFKKIISFFKRLFSSDTETATEPCDGNVTETVVITDSGETPSQPIVVEAESGHTDEADIEPGFVSKFVILVDNGHGYDTPGKRSPYSSNGVAPAIDFYEYKWNREIAKPVVDGLRKRGYDARLLVTEENDVSLSERVKRVNQTCDTHGPSNVILVSIHANAAGNGSKWMPGKGWSAFTTKGKTSSDDLAEFLYRAAKENFKDMKLRTDMTDGDSDWESDFYIIKRTYCTAVLTENFFYDNVDDVRYILSQAGREAVIKTHIDGIINYIKFVKK